MPEASGNNLRTAYLAVPDASTDDHHSANDSGFDSTTATLTLLPPALEDYENGRYRVSFLFALRDCPWGSMWVWKGLVPALKTIPINFQSQFQKTAEEDGGELQ